MDHLQGLLGVVAILSLAVLISRHRSKINWRIMGCAFLAQIAIAFLVLRWEPGFHALNRFSQQVSAFIGYAESGTAFVFGGLSNTGKVGFIFALHVLPVIIFLGAIIGLLYFLRAIQWAIEIVGTALSKVIGTSKIESVWASTVIFLGQTEAPLVIAPYLPNLTRSQLFTCMVGGYASVAGSTLVGYSLLGAPLNYLIAASVMKAPASLLIAKAMWPETEANLVDGNIRNVRDTESVNVIDAIARGALAGGKLAVIVGGLLIAFVSLIATLNGFVGGIGGWFGLEGLSFDKILGWVFAPIAWLIGVPWNDAPLVGNFLGQKTVLNEFVAYSSFGPMVGQLDHKTVLVTTFALAGFANFGSIAMQIGAFGAVAPTRRAEVARYGLLALLGGTLTNLLNASVAGLIGV